MNLKNLLSRVGVLLVLLTLFVGTALQAQTVYVSATNGDDTFGTGAVGSPYRTIQKAIDAAATGSTISIEAGVYNSTVLPGEGAPITLNTNRNFTFVGTAVGVNTTVQITDGFTLNNSNATATWGSSGTASFNFGTSATALVLTAGTMTITPANVILGSGATITVGNGVLNGVPTTGTNLNVTFNGTNAISSTVGFLPSSLGSGTLLINKASGDITVDNSSLSVTNLTVQNAANANVSGNLTIATNGDITHNGTGTLTIGTTSANTLTMTTLEGGVSQLIVNNGGTATVNSAVTYNVKNAATSATGTDGNVVSAGNVFAVSAASYLTVNGNITFNNTNVASNNGALNAIAHNVTLSNAGSKNLVINGSISTPLSSVSFSAPTGGNNYAYVTVILSNTSTGSFSVRSAALRGATGTNGVINTGGGTMTLGQAGDVFTTGYDVVNDNAGSKLVVNAGATFGGAFSNNNSDASGSEMVTFNSTSSIAGLLTNAAKIQINSNTITLSKTGAAALANTGDIYSTASATTGSGVLKFTGAAPTMTGTGNLPNVEIASATTFATAGNIIYGNLLVSGNAAVTVGGTSDIKGNLNLNGTGTLTINDAGNVATTVRGDVNMPAGSITLGTAGLTVEGTFNMSAGKFTFGTRTLSLKGNFVRTGGTIDAAAAGTGTLNFAGIHNQTFTPGTQMNVGNVTVANTGNYLANVVTDDQVTINGSLLVLGNFTITSGQVVLGTSNIRMEQTAVGGPGTTARFTNGGRGYTSNGVGGIIFEGTGANAVGDGDGSVLAGTQPYSNVYVRLTTPANNVYVLGGVKISGTVTLDGGGIIWNAPNEAGAVTDLWTASTLTLDNSLVTPTVVINTQNTHGSPFLVDGADGGASVLGITTVYNLSYTGQTATTIGASDFVSGSVNNLSLLAGTAGKTVTFIAGPGTIKGNLWIDKGETLQLTNGGAQTLTASGNTATHTVNGTVTGGTLEITGTGATLTSTDATGAASVANLTVDPAAGGTFTSTNMQNLGNLVINQAALTSTITFNSAAAALTTFTNTAGTTTLNMNSTASAITGNASVVAGNVTLTMNGAAAGTSTIGGTLGVSGGALTLGSNIYVTGATSQSNAGSLALGNYNLTLADNYTHAGTGTITAGTGALVSNTGAQKLYTFTSTVDIPNFTIKGTGIQFVTNGLKVTNAFVHTAGDLDLNSLPLTITGNTYTYTAGTYTNTGAAATGLVSLQGTALTLTAAGNPSYQYLDVNSAGTVTFASNNATGRSITVTTAFTHTKGNLALGIDDLLLTDNGAANASYTTVVGAGNVTGSTGSTLGEVVFSGTIVAAQNLTLADNYSVQNMRVTAANGVTKTDSKVLTVTDNFGLNGGNFTFANSARLVLGNGATITRSAGVFDQVPTFGTTVNVAYTGAVTTAKELPTSTTILNNLTNGANVQYSASATVNGTLYLTAGTVDLTTSSKVLTLATGATLNRSGGSFGVGAKDFPTVTTYNLVYSGGAGLTTGAEFVSTVGAVTSLTISNTAGVVQLGANRTVGAFNMSPTGAGAAAVAFTPGTGAAPLTLTVTGATTINNGIVSTNGAGTVGTLNVQGDLTVNGGSLASTTAPYIGLNLSLGGAAAQNLKLNGNITIPNITLNSTATSADSAVVNVTGGNLTTNEIFFVNGILNMGTNTLYLPNPTGAANSGLAFDRSGVTAGKFGNVVGNVSRAANTGDGQVGTNGRFEFPVGSLSGQYRPVAITFTPSYPVGNPTSIVVANVDSSAGGNIGLPLNGGNNVSIGGYANTYWLIQTNPSSFSPTQNFDIELTSHNIGYPYNSYNDLRMIRRQDGSSQQNNWLMQGTYANYANYQVVNGTDTTITVRTTSSIGGLVTAGSRFTIGVPSRAPLFVAPVALRDTVSEGTTKTIQFTANPQDVGSTITGYTLAAGSPSWATISASGLLTLAPTYGVGKNSPYVLSVTAASSNGLSTTVMDTIVVKIVNRPPAFTTVLPDTSIVVGKAFNFTYVASDPDGTALTYKLLSVTPALSGTSSIDTVSGKLTLTPAFADAGHAFTVVVTVTDGMAVVSDTAMVTVTHSSKRGDVNGDGKIDGTDAVQILNWVVGIVPPAIPTTGTELFYAADVDGNGAITVNDAYFALFAATHDTLPNGQMPKMAPASGDLSFSGMARGENGVINVPLRLANTNNVLSAYIELNIDSKLANIQEVASNLPQGWMMAHNYVNGKLIIAMTGTKPLNDGNFATISLKLNSSDTKLDISGSAKFNDDLGATLSNLTVKEIPSQFGLSQNYPNPFNPTTTIKYQIAQDTKVVLDVYDMLGQKVRTLVNDVQSAGYYNVTWDGQNSFGQQVSSGVYIYRLQAGNFVQTMKMNLLK